MALPVSPFQARYTRQQIADATGIESELLGYWIKEGLLIAAQGEGLGKGKHRHFGFEAIHIAALLKELGHYGVQTAGLKTLARTLWNVVGYCSEHPDITDDIRHDAAAVHRARARYAGRSAVAPGEEPSDADFSSFEDWLEARGPISEKAMEIEPWFDEAADLAFALYIDLFTEEIFESLDTRWIFVPANGELLVFPENLGLPSVDLERTRSYLTINLSLIIRPIWML
jgi:DNA-binding transcriptional MerR regulator